MSPTSRPKKHIYQVAWSSTVYDNEDWVGHFDCEATSAVSAIRQVRSYLREVHGFTNREMIIREVYRI